MLLETGLKTGGMIAGAGAMGVFCYNMLRDYVISSKEDSFLKNSLSFDRVDEDDLTMISREGIITRVFKIPGKNYSSLSYSDIELLRKKRISFFNNFAAKGLSLKFVTVRMSEEYNVAAIYDSKHLQQLHDLSCDHISNNYTTTTYAILSLSPKLMSKKADKSKLDNICREFSNFFHDYGVKLLTNKPNADGYSDLLSFWTSLVNGEKVKVGSYRDHISARVCKNSLRFDRKGGYFEHGNELTCKYGAIISISKYGDNVSSLMQNLTNIPCQMTIVNLLEGLTSADAGKDLVARQRDAKTCLSTDEELDQFDELGDRIQQEEVSLWNYQ